MKLGKS